MKLAVLSSLVAIVERGSLAAAADHVGCSPSAISLQVKQLEEWFGRPLFDRSARSVEPLPFALEVAEAVRDVTSRLEALRARPARRVSGRVRLGTIASVQTGALPRALRRLRDRHPELQVEISLEDSGPLLAALKAGRIDAAVLVRPPSGGSSRLAWQTLERQPFVLLAPPGAASGSPKELLQRHGLIQYDPALTGGRLAAGYVRRALPGCATRHGVAVHRCDRRHGGRGAWRLHRAAAAAGAARGASRAHGAARQERADPADRLRASQRRFGQPQPRGGVPRP